MAKIRMVGRSMVAGLAALFRALSERESGSLAAARLSAVGVTVSVIGGGHRR